MGLFPEQVYRHSTYSTLRAWRERRARYRLVGSKCGQCGTIWFPPRPVCGACNSRELTDHECAHTGVVHSFHVQDVPGATLLGHAETWPRVPALIRLDDGVFVLSEIVDCSPGEVSIGMRVSLVIRKQKRESNTNWMYGYKFAPDQKDRSTGQST